MKSRFIIIVFFVCIGSLSMLAAPPDVPISPANMKKMLGRGFDVSWAQFGKNIKGYSVNEVIAMKEMGFQNARIRTSLPADATLFTYLDRCVNDCLNHDIIPIIAHGADDFEASPTVANQRADSIWWAKVADHFKNISHKVIFDINIEWGDVGGKNATTVNNYYANVTPGIRATNPTRILVYAPIKRSNPENLPLMIIPTIAKPYVMAEWHLYASGPTNDKSNDKYWSTGTAAEKQNIINTMNNGYNWEKSTGIPTWVGAWMAGNYNDGNTFSALRQAEFAKFMVSEMERINVPWSINASDNYYDFNKNIWIDSMKVVLDVLSPIITAVENVGTENKVMLKGHKLFFNDNEMKEIKVYNLTGNLVNEIETNKQICELSSDELPNGMYIVAVFEKSKRIFSKKYMRRR